MNYRNRTHVIVEDPHRPLGNRYAPAYANYEPSPHISDRVGFWDAVWDKSKDLAAMLGGIILGVAILYCLNWVDDKYSICAKAKACISGVTKEPAGNEPSACYERGFSKEVSLSPATLTITCCACYARLDASAFQHLTAFSCVCPRCGSSLNVERIK